MAHSNFGTQNEALTLTRFCHFFKIHSNSTKYRLLLTARQALTERAPILGTFFQALETYNMSFFNRLTTVYPRTMNTLKTPHIERTHQPRIQAAVTLEISQGGKKRVKGG